MRSKKAIKYLTVISLPFAFFGSIYLQKTEWPNPIKELQSSPATLRSSYWKGMENWDDIKDTLSNKDTPDFCIASQHMGRYSFNCFQRIDKTKNFGEAYFLSTYCSREYPNPHTTICRQNETDSITYEFKKIDDINEYKRYIRYAGLGNPSVVDNTKTFFRTLLWWVTTILWFLSPFLLFKSLYILFEPIRKSKKNKK